MAATAVVSPTSYTSGPPPPYQPWSDPPARNGPVSPPESRRASDNKSELPQIPAGPHTQKQSLPSIHEALSGGPRPNPYRSPVSASFPPSQAPFSQPSSTSIHTYSGADHSYPPPQSQRPSSPPRPVHPASSSFSRSEAPLYEPTRHHTTPASGPQNPYASARYDPPRYETESRDVERAPAPYVPPPQGSYSYGPPPHQAPPASHHGPQFNDPRYQPTERRESLTWEKYPKERSAEAFQQNLKRKLEGWDLENSLSQIHKSSRNVGEWSNYYYNISQEQHRSTGAMSDRLPSLESCAEMMHQANMIVQSVTRINDMVQEQEQIKMADQRMREQVTRPGTYEDDGHMYSDDMKNQLFEGKKQRRGRAAPPGRCHSCNRQETPEWRRGPDGARTLCNACGLHYAKLTRKNNMKASQGSGSGSSIRPKSMDGQA